MLNLVFRPFDELPIGRGVCGCKRKNFHVAPWRPLAIASQRKSPEEAVAPGPGPDLIASDLVYQYVQSETSRVAFKPVHRRYYFSAHKRYEALLIRVHYSQ